jgi:hypothetical protein
VREEIPVIQNDTADTEKNNEYGENETHPAMPGSPGEPFILFLGI